MAKSIPTAPSHDRERGGLALLIIDMINCFDFQGADRLWPKAKNIVDRLVTFRDAMDAAKVPTIYVNDNFGEWHSEKSKLVERARTTAGDLIAKIAPRDGDYFIIKPQFSGFYATNLPLLLPKLGVSRLVITGIAADICVLFTAADAHMRDYAIWVPEDVIAAEHEKRAAWALELMREHLGAQTAATTDLDIQAWMASLDAKGVR